MERFGRIFAPMIMAGASLLSGCASQGTIPFSPASGSSFQQVQNMAVDKAVVYIYRPNPSNGLAGDFAADVKIPFNIKVNGKVITTLVQGGYYAYISEVGKIEFTAQEAGYSGSLAAKLPFSMTIDAKAGQAYYLKGAHSHGFIPKLSLVLVSPEAGAKEIADCKLISTILGSSSSPITPSTQPPSQGSSFQLGDKTPSNKAAVYIYRPITRQGKIPFEVNINGKVEITLLPGMYYTYFIEPGSIEFKTFETGFGASKSVSSISLDAKAGQAYYLKGADSKWGGHAHLEPVSAQAGADGIVNCKAMTAQ